MLIIKRSREQNKSWEMIVFLRIPLLLLKHSEGANGSGVANKSSYIVFSDSRLFPQAFGKYFFQGSKFKLGFSLSIRQYEYERRGENS